MHSLVEAPRTDPTQLYRYRDALYAEDLLIVGLVHLDFFTRLAAEPAGLEELCGRHGLKTRPAGVMLTLFRAMGLVVVAGDRFEQFPQQLGVVGVDVHQAAGGARWWLMAFAPRPSVPASM